MRPPYAPVLEDLAEHPVRPRRLDEDVGGRRRAEHERRGAVEPCQLVPDVDLGGFEHVGGAELLGQLAAGAGSGRWPPRRRCPGRPGWRWRGARSGRSRRRPPCRPAATSAWFTACMPRPSARPARRRAAASSSGTGNSRRPLAASRTRSNGVRPPSAAPLPSRPSSSSTGWTMTRSPTATPCTSSPTHSTTPAISWPSGMGRPVRPPMCTKETSVPQIPQAAIRTRASRGPGSGSGMSSRRTSWGPWTRICFIGPSPPAVRSHAPLPHGSAVCPHAPGVVLDRRGPPARGRPERGGRLPSRGVRRRGGPHAPEGECGDPLGVRELGSLRVPQSATSRSEPVRRQLCIFLEGA